MCKSLDHEIHLFWLELRFPIMCEPLAFSILLNSCSLVLFFCVCVTWSLVSVVLFGVRVLLGLALLLPHRGPRAAARVLFRPLIVHILRSKSRLARVFVGGVGTLTRSDCATKTKIVPPNQDQISTSASTLFSHSCIVGSHRFKSSHTNHQSRRVKCSTHNPHK